MRDAGTDEPSCPRAGSLLCDSAEHQPCHPNMSPKHTREAWAGFWNAFIQVCSTQSPGSTGQLREVGLGSPAAMPFTGNEKSTRGLQVHPKKHLAPGPPVLPGSGDTGPSCLLGCGGSQCPRGLAAAQGARGDAQKQLTWKAFRAQVAAGVGARWAVRWGSSHLPPWAAQDRPQPPQHPGALPMPAHSLTGHGAVPAGLTLGRE